MRGTAADRSTSIAVRRARQPVDSPAAARLTWRVRSPAVPTATRLTIRLATIGDAERDPGDLQPRGARPPRRRSTWSPARWTTRRRGSASAAGRSPRSSPSTRPAPWSASARSRRTRSGPRIAPAWRTRCTSTGPATGKALAGCSSPSWSASPSCPASTPCSPASRPAGRPRGRLHAALRLRAGRHRARGRSQVPPLARRRHHAEAALNGRPSGDPSGGLAGARDRRVRPGAVPRTDPSHGGAPGRVPCRRRRLRSPSVTTET